LTDDMPTPPAYTAPEEPDGSDDRAAPETMRYWTCDPTDGQVTSVRIVKAGGDRFAWVAGLIPPPGFSRFDRLLTKDRLFPSRHEAEQYCRSVTESTQAG
jgi:hypothetical protein